MFVNCETKKKGKSLQHLKLCNCLCHDKNNILRNILSFYQLCYQRLLNEFRSELNPFLNLLIFLLVLPWSQNKLEMCNFTTISDQFDFKNHVFRFGDVEEKQARIIHQSLFSFPSGQIWF